MIKLEPVERSGATEVVDVAFRPHRMFHARVSASQVSYPNRCLLDGTLKDLLTVENRSSEWWPELSLGNQKTPQALLQWLQRTTFMVIAFVLLPSARIHPFAPEKGRKAIRRRPVPLRESGECSPLRGRGIRARHAVGRGSKCVWMLLKEEREAD